jgi:hypothetical protein
MKTFSDNNLKKYDTAINIILIVLSLMLLVPIIQFLMKKAENNEDFYARGRRNVRPIARPRVALRPYRRRKGASFSLDAGAALPRGFDLTLPVQ